jgi:hypothetical protein
MRLVGDRATAAFEDICHRAFPTFISCELAHKGRCSMWMTKSRGAHVCSFPAFDLYRTGRRDGRAAASVIR